MSDTIAAAVAALNERLGGGIDGSIKFVIEDEGTVRDRRRRRPRRGRRGRLHA